MSDIRIFAEIGPNEVDLVGGKGLSLAAMTRAGLPVPPGFCVASEVHRRARGAAMLESTKRAIGEAYRTLGRGAVAVRSSATAEDGATASFAGQQETFLGISGENEVCEAVERCWASLDQNPAKP